ncbi:MAG: MoxR family ATPase [Spirochaetales bacterium]|nr:MoxR family ATPase [Spirochaetales bacterium]
MEIEDIQKKYDIIKSELSKVILGQEEVLRHLFISLILQGHILIESPPGLGKSLMARALSRVIGGTFKRVQFTPDLMPSDIIGTTVYRAEADRFQIKKGPVFTHILLADEINRASAKTQSALLEAMGEKQVSIGNETLSLEPSFFCIATQNPIEMEGTYPLPEAQQDRFLMKLVLSYPQVDHEEGILKNYLDGFDHRDSPEKYLDEICQIDDILAMEKRCRQVKVEEKIVTYITALVRETREHLNFSFGASPRGAVALLLASQVSAVLDGRDYVTPDDVKELLIPVLRHRVVLSPDAEIAGRGAEELLGEIIGKVEVPRS